MYNTSDKILELKRFLLIEEYKSGKCFADGCMTELIHLDPLFEPNSIAELYEKDKENNSSVFYLNDNLEYIPDFLIEKSFNKKVPSRKLVSRSSQNPSIFNGFCINHNAEEFYGIDRNSYENKQEINFLHAYRAFGHFFSVSKSKNHFACHKLIEFIESSEVKAPSKLVEGMASLKEMFDEIPDDFIVNYELFEPVLEVFSEKVRTLEKNRFSGMINLNLDEICDKNRYPVIATEFKTNINVLIHSVVMSDDCPVTLANYELEIYVHKLKENNAMEAKFKSIQKSKAYSEMVMFSRAIDGVYGITGSFVHQFDDFELITVTIFSEPNKGETQVLLSSFEGTNTDFDKIQKMEDLEFRQLISEIILQSGSNIFMSPSFFYNLDSNIQSYFLNHEDRKEDERVNIFPEISKKASRTEIILN